MSPEQPKPMEDLLDDDLMAGGQIDRKLSGLLKDAAQDLETKGRISALKERRIRKRLEVVKRRVARGI